jgi:tetratricopeptide (TPR) repeat protein
VKSRGVFVAIFAAIFLLSVAGCVTTDGSNNGWVVVDQPSSSPPPTTKKQQPPPPPRHKENRGKQVAAQNHLRSAYRFLQKDKPDHALRELEKARTKMRPNFWFHYYYGGAYYLKGMFGEARDSWERAYRKTQEYHLRSRIRTCQSFAIYKLDGEGPSRGVLKKAVNMDKENRTAWDLLQDLGVSDTDRQPGYDKSSSSPYVQEKFGQRDGPEKDDDKVTKNGQGNEKPNHWKADKKGQKDKKDKKDKKRKIQDGKQFRAYFLIEMR